MLNPTNAEHENITDQIDTLEEISETRGRRRSQKSYSQDVQDRFIQYVRSDMNISVSAAARTFGICISSAHAIMRRQECASEVVIGTWGGARIKKMTPEAIEAVSRWVDEKPDSTLQELRNKLAIGLSIVVCKQTISRALTRIGYTVKLIRALPESRNCPETLQSRREYAQRFLGDAPADRRNVIWVDETGFNLHLRRKYGRARIGNRASITVANNRGRNISVCAAMSEEGFLYDRVRQGAYNAEAFVTFLENLFEKLRDAGRLQCWIVLDNVRFHHCTIVHECSQRNGHTLVYLPPYSPMLNPIESLFGKWKTLIRTQGVSFTLDQLLGRMAEARVGITVPDCLGWIRDMNRNIGLSITGHLFE